MENKEMEKNMPAELKDDTLEAVSGGVEEKETILTVPTVQPILFKK